MMKKSSKILDENGEPIVLYHGAEFGGFTKFNNSLLQATVGGGTNVSGNFFTDDLNAALRYASLSEHVGEDGLKNAKVIEAHEGETFSCDVKADLRGMPKVTWM